MSNTNLVEVCANAKKLLLQDPAGTENRAALEVLTSYSKAAQSGELSEERLSGFLHGLATVGTLTVAAYADLKDRLQPLNTGI